MTNAEKLALQKHACRIRLGVIESTHSAKSGHPGGSLSIAEVLSFLYFREMRVDPANPAWPERDRLVLSKGHAAPALYAALAERGFFPAEELTTLRKLGSRLQGHPNMNTVPVMRSLPGMTVICPSDDIEARAAVRAAFEMNGPVYLRLGPVYLRLGRLAVPVFHDPDHYHFEIGKGETVTEGEDIAIIATGLEVNEARIAAGHLAAQGIGARVINIHTIKPLDEELILNAARDCGKVITCEEHSVIGGLGEAVCSLLAEKYPVPVQKGSLLSYHRDGSVVDLCHHAVHPGHQGGPDQW